MDIFVSLFSQKKININPTHIWFFSEERGGKTSNTGVVIWTRDYLPWFFGCVNSKEVTNLSHYCFYNNLHVCKANLHFFWSFFSWGEVKAPDELHFSSSVGRLIDLVQKIWGKRNTQVLKEVYTQQTHLFCRWVVQLRLRVPPKLMPFACLRKNPTLKK